MFKSKNFIQVSIMNQCAVKQDQIMVYQLSVMVQIMVKITGLSRTHGVNHGVIKVTLKCQETERTTAVNNLLCFISNFSPSKLFSFKSRYCHICQLPISINFSNIQRLSNLSNVIDRYFILKTYFLLTKNKFYNSQNKVLLIIRKI